MGELGKLADSAGAPIATVSQLGIGLTVARVWWLPRRLERVLPRLNV